MLRVIYTRGMDSPAPLDLRTGKPRRGPRRSTRAPQLGAHPPPRKLPWDSLSPRERAIVTTLDNFGRAMAPAELARALVWRPLDVRNGLRRLVASGWVTPKRRPDTVRERFRYTTGPAFRAHDKAKRARLDRGGRKRTPVMLPETTRKVALVAAAALQLRTLDVAQLAQALARDGIRHGFIVPRVRRAVLRKVNLEAIGALELAEVMSTRLG